MLKPFSKFRNSRLGRSDSRNFENNANPRGLSTVRDSCKGCGETHCPPGLCFGRGRDGVTGCCPSGKAPAEILTKVWWAIGRCAGWLQGLSLRLPDGGVVRCCAVGLWMLRWFAVGLCEIFLSSFLVLWGFCLFLGWGYIIMGGSY